MNNLDDPTLAQLVELRTTKRLLEGRIAELLNERDQTEGLLAEFADIAQQSWEAMTGIDPCSTELNERIRYAIDVLLKDRPGQP